MAEQTYTQAQANRLHVLLMEAMGEYVDHASWRCEYPPHYYFADGPPANGDCACGLLSFRDRVRVCLLEEADAVASTATQGDQS